MPDLRRASLGADRRGAPADVMGQVGVIIPNRNGATTLRPALEAVQRQSIRQRLTVVVVDNGSTDDSIVVARQFADILIEEPRPGSYHARNAAVAVLDTAYALTLDSDCRPADNDWAAKHVAALDAAPHDVFAVAGPLLPEASTDWWSQRKELTPHPAFAADGTPLYAVGGNGSLRLAVVRELGGYPSVGADDAGLGQIARERGLRTLWLGDAAVYHRNPCGARGYFKQMRKVGGYAAELGGPIASPNARTAVEFARAGWVASKYLCRGRTRDAQAAALKITAMSLGARAVWCRQQTTLSPTGVN